jgi:3-dehydroquinate dehydratase-1
VKFPSPSPLVVGSVTTRAGLGLLARAVSPADVVEVRVDALLQRRVAVEEIEAALGKRRLPVLLTLRIPAEGGKRAWTLPERRELFLRLMPEAEAIDVELASARALKPVIEAARRMGKTVVHSAHAIEQPSTPAQMAKWVAGFQPGPEAILKIASRIGSWRDLQRLAAVLVNHPDWQVAVMGLGPHGAQSRAVLVGLGSRLVYGHLDEAAAPGQPSAAEMRRVVRGLGKLGA